MTNEEYKRLQEELTRKIRKEAYKIDPLLWLDERLGEPREQFEWSKMKGYENHEWDGDIDPLAQAWKTIGNSYKQVKNGENPDKRFVGIEAATGTSKTFMLARMVFWFLDCFEDSLVVTSAPKQMQLERGLWSEISKLKPKISKLHPEAQLYKMRLAMKDSKRFEETGDEEELSNSWHALGFITGTGSNEDSSSRARGFHRKHMLIILEECTGIRQPVVTAFQNTSTGLMNYIVAVGNPDNEFDPLHQLCIQKDTAHFRISALDYPNVVLDKELYAGAVTKVSIQSRTDLYGETNPLWKAMVRGISPTQSSDSLIKLSWIENCVKNVEVETGYNAVGIDVANSLGGDKAALVWGQGNELQEIQEFQCPNATHLAYNVLYDDSELTLKGYENYDTKTLDDFDVNIECIGIDAVGVGVATVNAFKDEGYYPQALQGGYWSEAIPTDDNDKPMYKFASLRSQMYWELREDLRRGTIAINIKDIVVLNQLKKELCVPKFEASNANIKIEGKESIKKRLGGKSPNVADAVAYWNWVRKGYRIERFDFPAISGGG